MEQENSYPVEILYHLNPHLIWVVVKKACEPSKNGGNYHFEQIGLYGILPLQSEINVIDMRLETTKSLDWQPSINDTIARVIEQASEVFFSPAHIDRRTSIFDDNIHKYGEVIIKTKEGQLRKLSKILTNTNFAYFDECSFLKELLNFNLKTKLTNPQIQKVIRALEKADSKKEQPKNHWELSIQRHTQVFHDAQNFESALTESNLKYHNAANTLGKQNLQDIVTRKHKDFELCKDANIVSIGRGESIHPKLANKSSLLAKKLQQHKQAQQYKIDTPKNEKFKCFLLNKVDKLLEEENNLSFETKSSNQSVSINEVYQDVNTKTVTDDIVQSNYNYKTDDSDYEKSTHDANNISTTHVKNYAKNIMDEDDDIGNFENDPVYSKKFSKRNRKSTSSQIYPEFNINTEKLIAFGPPDVDCSKLIFKIIPKNDKGEEEEETKDGEHINEGNTVVKKEDPLAGLDSEVNFPISSQKYSKQSNQMCTNKTDSQVPFPISSQKYSKESNQMCTNKTVSQSLLKKLKFHKERELKQNLSASDTSQQDSSTDGYPTRPSGSDSDNESTISCLMDRLDLKKEQQCKPEKQLIPIHNIRSAKNHVNPFKNLDQSLSNFVEKMITPVLMVHTVHNNRIQPQHNLRDIHFNSEIRTVLTNMSIKHPMTLQTVSWSTILRGYSLLMVSPSSSGKTLGYTPAISRLVADYDGTEISDSLGPICIVVCATAKSVADVEKQCKLFLRQSRVVLACYTGVDERSITTSLLNGCDILVCTPSILVRLLSLTNFGVDMRRLSTCVLDDFERISQVYLAEIKLLLLKIKEAVKNRANKENKVQFIVASRYWCDYMETLAKHAPKSTVCINSFQECVLYSKTNLSVSFVKIENKQAAVLDFIKSIDSSKRTVIVCRLNEEVAALKEILIENKCKVFAENHSMTIEKLYNLNSNWANYEEPTIGPILVCCDENLSHLNITDAHYLIHYSLPPLFSMFSKRFSVLVDNYPSIFKDDTEGVKIKILLEETNTEQLPKIVNFIKRCSTQVPESLNLICDKIIAEKDFIKASKLVPICDNTLALGECPDFWNCKERHTLFQSHDEPMEWVPQAGVITFRILHYHTAVSYSVRLISNIISNKSHKYPQNYSSLSLKMGLYFSKEINRKLHGIPKVGDMCGVAIKQNFYERCQVVKILNTYEKNGNPNFVLVKLIDEEKWERVRDIYLYYLPEQFRSVNTYVVQIKLANIQPKDKDITFSDLAGQQIKNLLEKEEDVYLRAKIVLTIGTTVLVDNLEACRNLDHLQQTVVIYKIKEQLLQNHAIDNPDHISKLQKIIQRDSLRIKQNVLETAEQKRVDKHLPKPRWAHLESEDVQLVYFASAENPENVFIRLEKFDDCLQDLTKDIQKYIAKGNCQTVETVKVNDIVLAKFPDDLLFYRAKIQNLIDGNKCNCFFVDHGDWREVKNENIVEIPETFITRMPFQAIECRLVGIKPGGNTWTEFSTNWFCDQCIEAGSNTLKDLYVKYFTKEKADKTEGHKYGIVMIDTSTEVDIIINKSMIDLNLAQPNEDETMYFNELDFTRKDLHGSVSNDDDLEVVESYSNKISDFSEVQPVNLDNIFMKPPIRSFPLVSSDCSDDDDKWDVVFNNDDLNAIFKKCDPHTTLPTKSKITHKNLPAILPDDASKTIETMSNSSTKSISQSNDFEIIPSPKLMSEDLDSDDLTSSDHSIISKDKEIIQDLILDISALRKPKVCWRQNKTHVSFRIELIGVDKYEIDIKARSFKFETTVHDTNYGFDIELYGVIVPEKSSHAPKGLYIYVKLAKLLQKNWLSLTKDSRIKKWIIYDPDSIDASSDVDDDMLMKQETVKKIIESSHYNDSDDDIEDDDNYVTDDLTFKHKYFEHV